MKKRKHAHYFKDLTGIAELDIYRILRLYKITDQAIGHALKKLLVAGGRGAGKDVSVDIRESIETLERWEELEAEDRAIAFQPAPQMQPPFQPAPAIQPPPPPAAPHMVQRSSMVPLTPPQVSPNE